MGSIFDEQTKKWHEVDQAISGLQTDLWHKIYVQREAIPLVFLPGIMGTRLRRAGTGSNPDLRWDPSSLSWMIGKYFGKSSKRRKDMLVGPIFSSTYLEVDDNGTFGKGYDGFHGIMADYCAFLEVLRSSTDWGELGKIFEFPVYAVGYNWTDDAKNSGQRLAKHIKDIIDESKAVTGFCEKVILITHSMGGLVARWASEFGGAKSQILGIIHGVQPATGAPAAYWRIKAGFEAPSGWGLAAKAVTLEGLGGPILGTIAVKELLGDDLADLGGSYTLGYNGPTVTAVLGNIPGGLELLPNKLHRPNWLTVTQGDQTILKHPAKDPYEEIYRVPAAMKDQSAIDHSCYWGLVDPNLLDPGAIKEPRNENDALANAMRVWDAWEEYTSQLAKAEKFHDKLKLSKHPRTFCSKGTDFPTADVIELRIESNRVRSDPYPIRGFRGLFTNQSGDDMQAVLQDPSGDGDGTVPVCSAKALDDPSRPFPGDRHYEVKHQPAYEDPGIQWFTVKAILALCNMHYGDRRSAAGKG